MWTIAIPIDSTATLYDIREEEIHDVREGCQRIRARRGLVAKLIGGGAVVVKKGARGTSASGEKE